MRIGFMVNPIAGMGGRVGLKGTDGEDILRKARSRDAKPWAPKRALETLSNLTMHKDEIEWITWSGVMGANCLGALGFDFMILGQIRGKRTTAQDTKEASKRMMEANVDLILFAGGDGTASDIVEIVDTSVPMLGIPAGVKMFSGVFASTPRAASELLIRFLNGEANIIEREVMDVDEEAYRAGRLVAILRGYAKTPFVSDLILSEKIASAVDEEIMMDAIADRILEIMKPGVPYVLGPGSTVAKVTEKLGIEKTLLGVDVVKDAKLIVKDADERELLESVDGEAWIVLSPLGGQGSLLGRGNQQISPKVLRKVGIDKIIVIATPSKLQGMKNLTVDTGDPDLDAHMRGYRRVIIGRHDEKITKVR